jgi:hypothetical protein
VLKQNTQLSDDEKKELAGKILSSQGFTRYWEAKDEIDVSKATDLKKFKSELDTLVTG